jgi:hypothetical protein
MVDGKLSVILYNLGGVLFNLLFSGVLILLMPFASSYVQVAFMGCAAAGCLLALTNGIPIKSATVNNDGSNAMQLGKDPVAAKAFWVQLRVNAELMEGKRLREMPEEWFTYPKEHLQNTMVAATAVFRCNLLMDRGELEEADAEMQALLDAKSGMMGLHRALLQLERCYCALVLGKEADETIKLWDDPMVKNIRRAMKKFPSVLRASYAYAALYEKNEKQAAVCESTLLNTLKSYPYSGDAESERMLYELAKARKNS